MTTAMPTCGRWRRRRRRRPPPSPCLLLLLLLLAVLLPRPSVAPPINPGQDELKLPIVKEAVKVNLGPSESKDYRGSALCRVGDLDENGVDDMVLGAYGDDTTANDAGAIYILYLRYVPRMLLLPSITLSICDFCASLPTHPTQQTSRLAGD